MTTRQELFDTGLAIRREVLGADHVDRSIQTADDFNRPLQELVTEYAWGAVWSRPGQSRKTRSMLNLAMITAIDSFRVARRVFAELDSAAVGTTASQP